MTQELLKWLSTVKCWTVVVREIMLAFLLDKTIVDDRQNKIFYLLRLRTQSDSMMESI
jgi:hypothetical protein